MADDRTYQDYDYVENLEDIIEARIERDSQFADDTDAMEDVDTDHLPIDPNVQLTYPHPKTRSDEDGRLGINVELADTPKDKEVEFDWQDNAEEMLPTDPPPNDGMGDDGSIEAMSHVSATDVTGPAPSVEYGSETATDATEEEKKIFGLDGGEPDQCRQVTPVALETAMDSDSDEYDFSIEDKFEGEKDRETALLEFEDIRETIEKQPEK
ncbi:MAG: hypothetical protein ACYC27_17325 [Armatimonadota bacterium]